MKKSQHTKKYAQLLAVLRQAREDAGLTQTQVARHFGAHASFVSKCESGERRIDPVELADFCRIYKVTISQIVRSAGLE